jgi:hypothetical protein
MGQAQQIHAAPELLILSPCISPGRHFALRLTASNARAPALAPPTSVPLMSPVLQRCPAAFCTTHVGHRPTPPPPFTYPVTDQDACVHLDSLSSISRPRRTTPVRALVAAALGHVSGNRRLGRQVFFHVNFIPSFLPIPRRADNLVSCGIVHSVSERHDHVDCSN